jgi:protein-S-isoprenylcysteine O-methyltransferase Ste14
MNTIRKAKWTSILVDCFLALGYLIFLYYHLTQFFVTGRPSLVVVTISEAITVILFLLRKRDAISVSKEPLDYALASLGTILPLLFRPADTPDIPIVLGFILIGFVIQIGGLLSLNRSFGIVAANRGFKTKGFYSFVRHPIYLGYLVIFLGYLITNHTKENLLVFLVAFSFQILRIFAEEKHLSSDPMYRDYTAKVKWRLIPLIF